MLLIAGLGNPGRRYAGHRHNIGFMAADAIHRRHQFQPWRARFEGEIAEGEVGGEKTLLLKPATYMNESGRAVGQAVRFYKLAPGNVVVIYDELDLPPGKLRMKSGGSTAGHRGLRSIEAHIGKDFRRMRIGIGHPGSKELVNGYVLHDFAKADEGWREPLIAAIAEHAGLLSKREDATFMNRIHLATAAAEDGASAASDARTPKLEKALGSPFLGLRRLFGREG